MNEHSNIEQKFSMFGDPMFMTPATDLDILFYRKISFLKFKKFVNSDEGLPCVNTIEKVYLGLLVTVFALGILSLFRMAYFKPELRKVFDSRQGFTNIQSLVFVTIIFDVKNSCL